MKLTPIKSIAAVFMAGFFATAYSQELSGKWLLKIENLDHKLITSAEVQFTQESARSCLIGNWHRVVTASSTTIDGQFFPVKEPLSYQIDGATLTIGRNELCDDYRHLTGSLNEGPVVGNYTGFGITGGENIGYFSLSRVQ